MKKFLVSFFIFFIGFAAFSQEEELQTIKGFVLNAANDLPLKDVHIVNLNTVKGTVSGEKGNFELQARINDNLYFSYLGFKSIQVRVTNDWTKYGDVKVKMTEIGIALEEVVVTPLKLTGYLEIDAKNIPIYDNSRYSISGLDIGVEAGDRKPGAFSRTMSAIFNPVDLLYNTFGKKPRQMKKLRQMKEDDEIRNLLQQKYNRETLVAVLQVDKVDLDEILSKCNYSKQFIQTANDLQILDALSSCYEEYRVLNRD